MNTDELRALQAPLKDRYRAEPGAGRVTLRAEGSLDATSIACKVETGRALAIAGVTLKAVATSLGLTLRSGQVSAEGDLDFRGTLGVDKQASVGFTDIRLKFALDADATPDQIATLLRLTERYCVVLQTLRRPPTIEASVTREAA